MKKAVIVAVFLGIGWGLLILWGEIGSRSSLLVAFFDVGQGDSIFFETPQGHQVLIDGGPDRKVLSRLGEVMPFWDKTLDLVVLTHPDADHVTGLISVLERYQVQNVLWTGKAKDTRVFEVFQQALAKEDAEVLLAQAGQRIVLGNSGAELLILYPGAEVDLQEEESNETSIIAKLVYGENEVLLPGDTTKKIEQGLLAQGTDLKADILKVAHHGSRTSSSREFLEAVAPDVGVISVGKDNRFGHPAFEVLANLAEYGISVKRTDQEGTIYFTLR